MKAKQALVYAALGLIVCLVVSAAVFIPEVISKYHDGAVLSGVTLEEKDAGVEGYRYNLNASEKLYVLSNALNNRVTPQSDYFAAIRGGENLSDVRIQSYAFQAVYNESAFNEETREGALGLLQNELDALNEKGILPEIEFDPGEGIYEAALFTAIDVLEPKRSVTVWYIGRSDLIVRGGLVECVMDAQTGKIYSVSLRADRAWEEYDPDEIIRLWAAYVGISEPEPLAPGSELAESATYYKKYEADGVEGDSTIVTVGYFEGISEFFIKISK